MPHRQELVAAIAAALREQAGRSVLLHQAVAERFGLNATDLKCLELARTEPEMTPGRLAEATWMSTSAVTSVLDRLEQRGFVERRRDARDRRRVVVACTGLHEAELGRILEPVNTHLGALLDGYRDDQLEAVSSLLDGLNARSKDLLNALRARQPGHEQAE